MISFLDSDFSQINQFLAQKKVSKIFILVDENTHEYCLPSLLPNLEIDVPFEIIEIEAGEEMKNIETATQLWEILAEFEADRNALLINLGGGVITDMGGFVASTYKRGIDFIHIPTTLLAMCDASLGGKTGIDLHFLKNMVGSFALPEMIFVNPNFLTTLPYHELRSGFAEMLKHGLIADINHWNDLISISEISVENLTPMIKRSMEIKQHVVEIDFKEQNIRKSLNFGHTFGHALESLYLKNGNPIPHGEAVAMGILAESYLSAKKAGLTTEELHEINSQILRFFPYHPIDNFSDEAIIQLMLSDKKNFSGQINFSLISKIGASKINCTCSLEEILEMIEFYRGLN